MLLEVKNLNLFLPSMTLVLLQGVSVVLKYSIYSLCLFQKIIIKLKDLL